jgi:membrane protein
VSNSSEAPTPFSSDWWKRAGQATWIAAKDFFRDDGPYWSASIAYYALLSAIPVLLLIALAASLAVDSGEAVEKISSAAGDLLPVGEERIEEIVENSFNGRGVAGFFSIVVLLWSGTRVFGAISRGLNVAYDVEERYVFWKQFLLQVAMLFTVGGMLILGLGGRFLMDQIWAIQGISEDDRTIVYTIARNVLPFAFTAAAFFLVYRFVPKEKPSVWPALTGAVLAAITFFIARELFSFYEQNFADYDQVYGPLALLIAVIIWVWIAGVILLIGGQLVAHYHEILVQGEDPEDVEQRHKDAKEKRDRPHSGSEKRKASAE